MRKLDPEELEEEEGEDPRGVASPPDPHGEDNRGTSGGGGRINERLTGTDYPEDDPDSHREPHTCPGCDKEIPRYWDKCSACRRRNVGGNSSDGSSTTESLATWHIDRVVVAVVDEHSASATPIAKAGLEKAIDSDGALKDERVTLATEFDDDPPAPLDDYVETLPDLIPLEGPDAPELLRKLDQQDTDEPVLVNEFGKPLRADCDRESIRSTLGKPEKTHHLCAGVVETVNRNLPDDLSADNQFPCLPVSADEFDGHPLAPNRSVHERAMEGYREKHGHYPFEEPTESTEDDPTKPSP